MGFRFRKSVHLFPGVRVNFSLSGMSVSAGVPGMMLNMGTRRTALTMGIPGTGLSYVHTLGKRGNQRGVVPSDLSPEADVSPEQQSAPETPSHLPGEIASAHVASLTSPDLAGLKRLINEAAHQKKELEPDWQDAVKWRLKTWKKLRRRELPPLRFFAERLVPKARAAFEDADGEALKVAQALAASEIKVRVDLDARSWSAWEKVVAAHRALSSSSRIWDVTTSVRADRIRERTIAGNTVTRTPVALRSIQDAIVSTGHNGLRFENANGGDLDLFPGFVLIRDKASSDYALVDMREIEVRAGTTKFIETEAVPSDSEIVDYTWAKANKDGSPDRRFNDNHQIPIVEYGEIRFSSSGGISEGYLMSRANVVVSFGAAIREFQQEIRRQAKNPKNGIVSQDEASGPGEAVSRLPPLPVIRGAYDVIMVPMVAAAAFAAVPSRQIPPPSNPVALVSPVAKPPDAASPSEIQPSAPAATTPPAAAFLPLPSPSVVQPGSDQMVTTTNVNVRSAPDRSALSKRVLAAGTKVLISERKGSWLLVGDGASEPWGWVHASALKESR